MAASRGELLHGVEAARTFFRDQRNGGDIKVSPYGFRERGDCVEVLGLDQADPSGWWDGRLPGPLDLPLP